MRRINVPNQLAGVSQLWYTPACCIPCVVHLSTVMVAQLKATYHTLRDTWQVPHTSVACARASSKLPTLSLPCSCLDYIIKIYSFLCGTVAFTAFQSSHCYAPLRHIIFSSGRVTHCPQMRVVLYRHTLLTTKSTFGRSSPVGYEPSIPYTATKKVAYSLMWKECIYASSSPSLLIEK